MRHWAQRRWLSAACILLAAALIIYGIANALPWGGAQNAKAEDVSDQTAESDSSEPQGTEANPYRADIKVGLGGCTSDWKSSGAGAQVFSITNTSDRGMEVQLMGTGDQSKDEAHKNSSNRDKIYAELEALGPGVTRDLTTSIGPGHYHFTCMPDDASASSSQDVSIAEPDAEVADRLPRAVTPAAAATEQEIIPYTQNYEKWVKQELPDIAQQADELTQTIQEQQPGWREHAQSIWTQAHHHYMTLGAAYGAFGDLGDEIDGTAAGLEKGDRDPEFTGFHRIEKGLWSDEAPDSLLPLAQGLRKNLQELQDKDDIQVGALEIGLRSHEISEDIATLTLSGQDDFGSHSGLDSSLAQLQGTRKLIDLLHPLLAERMPDQDLSAIYRRLDSARDTVQEAASSHPHTAPAELPQPERGKVRSQVAQLSEQLGQVAAVTDIRRAS